ncbi:unnamed protein product [Medioppia subpectinata]|uniref:C2H2-type domain-containing protein n=1 Tax=Medioppia subpectinata TaxID=1979941 RepID=A0A7R9KPG9_9ACAR|nr:unnamed protein product [Medioppia subpectinata]CAG2107254.1 unnamed protein product [Medioppia subpectinata]
MSDRTITAAADDSQLLTYESIFESFVRQKSFKCHYDGCDKGFATQRALDSHISRRHAIEDNTQSGEPIGGSSHVRHQSLSAALDGRQQIPIISTTDTSLPLTITTTTTTSSADTQCVANTLHNLITSSDAGDQSMSRAPDGRQQMPTITTTSLPPQPPVIATSTSRPDRNSSDITDQSMRRASDVSEQKPEITATYPSVSAPTIITTTTSSPDRQFLDITLKNPSSADIKGQSLTTSLNAIHKISKTETTVVPSLPQTVTTSSADSQLVDITSDNDSDSDIELIGRVPAPKRPARNRSPVDIKPSLVDSIPLVPNIVKKAPEVDIKVTGAGNELIRDIAPGIRVVKKRKAPVDPRLAAKTTRTSAPDLIPWYPCPYMGCRQTFNTQSLLTTHMQSIHSWVQWSPDLSYPCDKCDQKYSTGLALHNHQAVAHPKPAPITTTKKSSTDLIPCPSVPNIVQKAPEVGIKRWQRVGNELIRDIAPDIRPVGNTTATSKLKCPHTGCGQTLQTNKSFKRHATRCKWRLRVEQPLTTFHSHSLVQRSADQRFPCDKCHLKYGTELALHNHRALAHPMPNALVCPNTGCVKTFPTNNSLHKHLERCCKWRPTGVGQPVATTSRPSAAVINQCPECWQTFKRPRQLHRHRALHCQSGASHLCRSADCGKTFQSRKLLQKHIKTHRKYDKPLTVNRPPMAATHKFTASAPMRYLCRHVGCHQGFTDKHLLFAHVQAVHVSAALYDPSASVHPADRHRCSRCDNTFVSMRALFDHQMLAHR